MENTSRLSVFCLVTISLIAIFPFLYPVHQVPIVSFYNEWIALALGIIGFLVFLTPRFWNDLRAPKVALYLLAFVAVVAAQNFYIARPYLALSLTPGLYLVWAFLLMVLATWLRTTLGAERVAATFAWFVLVGALLQALTGLVQYLGIAGWLAAVIAFKQGMAIYGNVAQANHFATHLVLGAIALTYLYSRKQISVPTTFVLLAFFAYIATLSGSRSILIYAAVLCALSLVGYYKQRDITNFRLLTGSSYFLVALISSQWIVPWLNPWLALQLADISLNIDPFAYSSALERVSQVPMGMELRTSEWHKAWLMFTHAPILGVGIGNYGSFGFVYQSLPEFADVSKPALFSHSHNIFAQVLAETGIVGLSILVAMLAGWVKQFKENWLSPHAWYIAATLFVLFIHSNLEYPLWYSYFLGIAAFLLALGDTRTISVKFSPRLGQATTLAVLLLVSSILVSTLSGYRKIADLSDPFIEPQERINLLLTYGNNPILMPYTDLILLAMMPTSKDSIKEKLAISTRAFRRNPDFYKAYKQTTLLALNGQKEDAKALLAQSARAYPASLPKYIKGLKTLPDPEVQPLVADAERILASTPIK
jgi:O-antigen ligase